MPCVIIFIAVWRLCVRHSKSPMKKGFPMAETMSKFLTLHRRYERYCTLAATGQLGGPEMFELNEHIASCSSCREYLESISQVSVQAMPLLAANRNASSDAEPPEGMRERFLSRLDRKSTRLNSSHG